MTGIRATNELHKRRFSRNLGVGLTLAFFVAVVFGLTVVKVKRGDQMQSFDKLGATGAVEVSQ